ncbi:hypothetical protein TNCV_2013081 [Trichonephila clavipes]|nr:hypothetical protein TNCV_2013081 [Trichonephila clavipes]
MNNSVREGDAPPFFETSFNLCRGWIFQLHSACVEVGTNNKYSTCVEVGTHRRKFRLCRGWKTHRRKFRLCRANIVGLCCSKDLPALAVETKEKRNRFEQTSRTLQRKISMRSTKDQLVEKDVLMPVKHNVFLWNLPDVEEVPSHDGETV